MNKIEGRYWNSNGKAIAIVALVSLWKKGENGEPDEGDWAAYIGADDGWSEKDCIESTSSGGAQLSAEDAEHFFPEIKLPYRW